MQSLTFLEDERIHRDLIQKAYESLISDHGDVTVIMKDNKKVKAASSALLKVFSSTIKSIMTEKCSDDLVVVLPDFDEKHFTCLIDILTEGTTMLKTMKNVYEDIEKITDLSEYLGPPPSSDDNDILLHLNMHLV